MGAYTQEQINQNKTKFAGIDQKTGNFDVNGNLFAKLDGQLLGFSEHEFEFQGKIEKKFDIFLKDDNSLFQIQLGFYSWHNFKLMNSLANIGEKLAKGGILGITSLKQKDNYSLYVDWNGENIKWKYSFEELKLKDMYNGNKIAKRNKIIDKWANLFTELKPYVPEIKSSIPEETIKPGADDDIPF